ncbi:hypothetical protein NRB56_23770 [Nocardia sp. RB56]|uniref:Uncharacterized protein n=1 Tax=Nocardia aurantia TaxID=2585199 RepID=A0A7K0DPR0_9NOCA|nr:hypothetical protein [Nocardia aurantia]
MSVVTRGEGALVVRLQAIVELLLHALGQGYRHHALDGFGVGVVRWDVNLEGHQACYVVGCDVWAEVAVGVCLFGQGQDAVCYSGAGGGQGRVVADVAVEAGFQGGCHCAQA